MYGRRALGRLVAFDNEGIRLDRFELVAELATGGMATVYLARVSGAGGFQRFVAIKRLHPHLAREPEFIEMFLDEARLAARIHHPNVVSILEIGSGDQGYYIVMEYVEGDTLGRLLSRCDQSGQRLPVKVGLRIVTDMLAGLEAAHELKDDDGKSLAIVHRDVSPQNVLVGVDGSARLSDFGVARAASRLSTTRSGQLKGKVAYMAPEQARTDSDIDRRADVFAAGVVLWEVLGGRRLFQGDGEAQTLNKVLTEPIPRVSEASPSVDASLEAVVAKALERDRAARFATAAEFADALEAAAQRAGAIGASKDVAAYVQAMLGPEISEQREAVRAWVARSEPGRRSWSQPPPPVHAAGAAESSAVSPIERGELSAPRMPSIAPLGSVPGLPNLQTPPRQPGRSPDASGSARIVDAAVDSTRRLRAVSGPSKTEVWPWLLLVAAAVGGGVLWMTRPHPAPAGQLAAPEPPPSIAASAATLPPALSQARAPEPSGATSASNTAGSVAPAARPEASTVTQPPRAAPKPRVQEVGPSANPSPAASGRTVGQPDDISRNPYR
jgi:serine/threonine-protein kinase